MNKYKWQLKEAVGEEMIARFPEVEPAVLQLLIDRGLDTQEKIDEFLHPDYSQDIHDPYLFADMQKAVERIFNAIKNNEPVVIYGDYDADGVCGSAILATVFKKLQVNFETYLPDREKEGYGLNETAVKQLAKNGVKLIITVDCGISNTPEVELANSLGMEVIITDHHHVPEKPPQALAIIHPKFDKNYPFDDLAGGGVAFKLAQALIKQSDQFASKAEKEGFEKWLLDLVTISTIADLVPLLGENRTLVTFGLIVLAKTKNLGLQKLMEVAALNIDKMDARMVGFQIAPRINAAGRMAHANSAYQLLTTDNIEEAIVIANQLNKRNVERQNLVDDLVTQAKSQLGEVKDDQPVLFAVGEGWNPGVIGLVASKLTQDYARPSIVLNKEEDKMVASGRSVKEFNLIENMDELSDYFIKYGGHSGAAGFSIKIDKFEEFREKFINLAKEKLSGVKFVPTLVIDRQISLPEANWQLVEMLDNFRPYGWSNYQPRFLINNLNVQTADTVGQKNNHLRLMVEQDGVKRKIICFGFGDVCEQLNPGDVIDAVCEIGVNEWNGNREIQLSLIDIKKK